MAGHNILKTSAIQNNELMYSVFCCGIAFSLIFWPLLNSLLCIGFFLYWLLFTRKSFGHNRLWVLLFCLLYLITIIGALHSDNNHVALSKLQHKSAYILFPLIFGTYKLLSKEVFKRTTTFFILSTLLGIIVCLASGVFRYFNTGIKVDLYGYNLVSPLKDMTPFMMGMCCLLCLLSLCDLAYRSIVTNSKFERLLVLRFLGIISLFIFLLLLGNRNILISASCVLLYYFFKLIRKLWIRLLITAGLLAIFTISITVNPFLNKQWRELIRFSSKNSLVLDKDMSLGKSWGGWELRKAIWNCSWDVIKNNPVLGVGTGDVQDSLQAAYEKRKFYFASRYNRYNTHNQYLQETVANGVVGLLVFLLCLIVPLFAEMPTAEKEFYGLFIFCFAFGCLTDTPLELNKGIIWYAFFNTLIFFKSYNFNDKIINGKETQ